MEIIVKLFWMVFEISRDGQDHLRKRDLTTFWRAHGKFRLEKRFEIHDCRYCSKAYGSLSEFLTCIFGIGSGMLPLNYIGSC